MKIEFWWRQIFKILIIHKPGVPRCPTKNLVPIGSAVLTFIGYKQTDRQRNKQTDKPNLYIDKTFLAKKQNDKISKISKLYNVNK